MVARSTTREAGNLARENQLTENGYDLMIITEHHPCCGQCARVQGRVFSISGNDKRFPPLSAAFPSGYQNVHPNCSCVAVPWIEELQSPEELKEVLEKGSQPLRDERSAGEKALYTQQQSDSRQMRADLVQYQRYKARLGDDAPKSFSAFRRMKNAGGDRWNELQKEYRQRFEKSSAPVTVSEPEKAEGAYNDEKIPENYIDKYPNSDIIETKDNSPVIPEEIVNDVNKAVDKFAGDFPVIREQVEPIVYTDIEDALGENGLLPGRAVNVVRLSDDYCSDYDKLRKKLADDFESHISYETDNAGSLACHELGHALHKILAMKRAGVKYGEVLTPIKKKIFEQELQKIKGEVYLAAFSDETLEEIDDACIGELGTMTYRNPDELIAQSFGNYYYGKSKSQVGKAIVEYFKRGLA